MRMLFRVLTFRMLEKMQNGTKAGGTTSSKAQASFQTGDQEKVRNYTLQLCDEYKADMRDSI